MKKAFFILAIIFIAVLLSTISNLIFKSYFGNKEKLKGRIETLRKKNQLQIDSLQIVQKKYLQRMKAQQLRFDSLSASLVEMFQKVEENRKATKGIAQRLNNDLEKIKQNQNEKLDSLNTYSIDQLLQFLDSTTTTVEQNGVGE